MKPGDEYSGGSGGGGGGGGRKARGLHVHAWTLFWTTTIVGVKSREVGVENNCM